MPSIRSKDTHIIAIRSFTNTFNDFFPIFFCSVCVASSIFWFGFTESISYFGNHLEQKHTHLHIDFVNAVFIYFLFGVGVGLSLSFIGAHITRRLQIDSIAIFLFFSLPLSLVLFSIRFISFPIHA